MSIVESTSSRSHGRIFKWEGLAGGALVAAAVFAASPKPVHGEIDYTATGGTTTDPNAAGAVSWFNTANWNGNPSTGTLPESYISNGSVQNIIANNTSMPSVGVVFDPADDANTPAGTPGGNANYVANIDNATSSFYVSSAESSLAAPNKLTIESGTIIAGTTTVGRDAPGILTINGGTFITSIPQVEVGASLKVQGSNRTTILGSGTLEYHGGYIEVTGAIQDGSGNHPMGVGATSAGVGTFVVYNDGPAGAILSANGFQFATNNAGAGTIGIVEFHYDIAPNAPVLDGVKLGQTRPIQTDWQTTNGTFNPDAPGILSLKNGTNLSARLNLVLDVSPGQVQPAFNLDSYYLNLGLFDDTVITGNGTFPKAFYSVDGTTVFTQGATISAVYNGSTYSWTISYSGQINFTNTATSSYNSALDFPGGIQATGGNDVVLIGITPIGIPEPGSATLLSATGSLILARRRTRNQKKPA